MQSKACLIYTPEAIYQAHLCAALRSMLNRSETSCGMRAPRLSLKTDQRSITKVVSCQSLHDRVIKELGPRQRKSRTLAMPGQRRTLLPDRIRVATSTPKRWLHILVWADWFGDGRQYTRSRGATRKSDKEKTRTLWLHALQ